MPEENSRLNEHANDETKNHLRILYLYQLLLTESNQDHMLSTTQIRQKMEEYHGNLHGECVGEDLIYREDASNPNAAGGQSRKERKKELHVFSALPYNFHADAGLRADRPEAS